ncbi:MurR/RpiR family transcriptional regulator [Desnuesiella massiliensis]|uniref:MurR/RpiR family transcriptional regulator n=1 Tax=Desnuesiella massiliensis TaxID=1650662 RepID=UPI0006E39FE9|nr:MurR/RpiR family transcriptional regulator [Desnuesiella massiliensis]
MQYVNNIILQMEKYKNQYTETDMKIMEFISSNIEFVIENSIGNIAKGCGVSEASITRFSRKSGFKGFNELKLLLGQEHFKEEVKEEISEPDSLLNNLVNDIKELVSKGAQLVNKSNIEKCVKYFKNSKRIKIYALSASGYVAEEMSYKFGRIGFDIRAISDPHYMLMDAALSDSEDLIIGICFSGETTEVIEAIAIAKENGCKTVVFTHYIDSELSKKANATILLPVKDLLSTGEFINSHIAMLVLIDYLYAEIVTSDMDKYLSKRAKTIKVLPRPR